jgi:hypothetical protein
MQIGLPVPSFAHMLAVLSWGIFEAPSAHVRHDTHEWANFCHACILQKSRFDCVISFHIFYLLLNPCHNFLLSWRHRKIIQMISSVNCVNFWVFPRRMVYIGRRFGNTLSGPYSKARSVTVQAFEDGPGRGLKKACPGASVAATDQASP